MEYFKDIKHDIDSCMDVWEGLYKKIYPQFFDTYFDFPLLKMWRQIRNVNDGILS